MTVSHQRATDASASPPLVPQRHPFGVRVIIALFIVKVTLMLIVIALLYLDFRMGDSELDFAWTIVQEMPTTLLAFAVLLPLNLVAAIGLWRRKRWAWVLTMVLIAYSMVLDIVNYGRGQPIYLSMLLNVIQVGYLNQKEVQMLFHAPDQAVVS